MSQKKATIVNLAASNVSVSQFSVEAGSLVLEQFFVEEIAPGLTGDDEWLNAAIAALASLVNTHEIRGRVTVIAPLSCSCRNRLRSRRSSARVRPRSSPSRPRTPSLIP